ncbi:hypothetical protein RRG08_028889 [Elysia crispata]|uniref:Uncharacterized protein n=1 Tax=Elysia crispata TaxID=231223 RepID=A0AAE1A1Q5_9GAST|nr:hypothetical protein RRG08_028889 [Elysia crispata]
MKTAVILILAMAIATAESDSCLKYSNKVFPSPCRGKLFVATQYSTVCCQDGKLFLLIDGTDFDGSTKDNTRASLLDKRI